ncbi:MAG: hypothetical protein AAF892_05715 [Cyanobacteria bacterium P01_D01_bin.71]
MFSVGHVDNRRTVNPVNDLQRSPHNISDHTEFRMLHAALCQALSFPPGALNALP